VTIDEARQLAQNWGCPFLETSALTNTNVNESFFELGLFPEASFLGLF
jgi:hypothetical protein